MYGRSKNDRPRHPASRSRRGIEHEEIESASWRGRRVGDSQPWRRAVEFRGRLGADPAEDWPDRFPGPELGDYAGLPLNANDRMRAESWSASILSLPDYQCRVHPADYAPNSFAHIRMWHESTRHSSSSSRSTSSISRGARSARSGWTAGRIRPTTPSTRRWVSRPANGSATPSKVTTTHLKEGWLRRNGVARSDSGDRDRALHSARQPSDLERLRPGSEVSRGAVLPQPRLTRSTRPARSARIRAKAWSGSRGARGTISRTTCRGRTRSSSSTRRSITFRSRPRWAARRRCTPSTARSSPTLPQP